MRMFVVVLAATTVLSEDFCGTELFQQSRAERRLMFSKELSDVEYSAVGNFVSLHCCASYFRTIEWFKDGQAYPWRPGDVSSLIINPASHNQTIYTQRMSALDAGNYYCLVSNASHVLRHQVTLTTIGALTSVGPPRATYKPRDMSRQIGESARFYCEAYVGNINLPDAKSEIHWSRDGTNQSTLLNSRITQRVIDRGNKRIVGAFLTIDPVEEEDFGQFWCTVSNAGDQILQLPAILYQVERPRVLIEESDETDDLLRLCFGLVMALVTSAIFIYIVIRYRLRLRIMWKHIWNHFHSPDESEVDILVVHHERDTALALGQIVPTLRHRFHYVCSVSQFQTLSSVSIGEISSRRILAIVTPDSIGGVWNSRSISQHIVTLLSLHPKVICLFFKELPQSESKTEDGRHLKDSLAKVHYVAYNETQDNNFWTIVQLGLPVHRRPHRHIQCRESLENLM